MSQADPVLVDGVRAGCANSWQELIARFEGRLLAFVQSRLGNRAAAEDVVQETFVGFLTSLPNYDASRPLEGYLFSIAAHKLTDHLRREGRRPTVPLLAENDSRSDPQIPGRARGPSSIVRSGERRGLEETSLAQAIDETLSHWRKRGDWEKIRCAELLFLRGWANKRVAGTLKISEQTVANHKYDFLAKLRTAVRNQGLPEDVFPELHEP